MPSRRKPFGSDLHRGGDGADTAGWLQRHRPSAWDNVKKAFRHLWERDETGSPDEPGPPPKAAKPASGPALTQHAPMSGPQFAHPETPTTVDAGPERSPDADTPVPEEPSDDGWEEAEQEGRFGFSARSQYSQFDDWTEELALTLRHEWEKMHPARPFEDAQKGIRRGWEFTRPRKN